MGKIYFEMMEIGCLAFMSAYQFVLFFQVRKKYYLILSIICFTIMIRSLIVDNGSQLLLIAFPDLPFSVYVKLIFIASYSNIALAPMFIQSIFNLHKFKEATRICSYMGLGWVLFVLISPHEIYTVSKPLFMVNFILVFFYIFWMLYIAIKIKRTGAIFVTMGMVCIFLFAMMELLRAQGIAQFEFDGPNLINTGMVFFLFFLSVALSSIYAESFKENMKWSTELNERVLERTKELSESNVVKERIIRIISHDLRSPLANLYGLVSIAQLDHMPKEDLDRNFKKINDGVGETINMLDDLLAWASSSAKSDKLKIYFEKVDVKELIVSRLKFYMDFGKQKKIRIVNRIRDVSPVRSDQNVLKVVIRNLITNAIKFSHENSTIEITAHDEKDFVMIQVTDHGIGIPDEMKESIFEMEVKNNRPGTANEKSTGIGLGLVKDLISQNGGTITVTDNPYGQGSTFEISIPKWVDE